MTYRQKRAMHAEVDATARKWDPKFASAAAKSLRHDKRELIKRMRTKAEVEWTVIGRKWDEYFERFADEAWREEFMPLIEGLVAEQGENWNATLGMQFDVRNWLAEAWLDDYMLTFAQDINDTTKKDVSSILLDAMQQGWGIGQMTDGLGLLFDKYISDKRVDCSRDDLSQEEQWFCDRQPKYRRENIARTETMRSSNSGSQALFGAMGAQKHEWWGTGDDRLRDSHLVAWMKYSEGGNPGPIPIGQPFEVGSSRLMQPGDPSGAPEDVIQCRCTVLPFMDTWAGTEEEIAAARADMDAEVARREAAPVAEMLGFSNKEEATEWLSSEQSINPKLTTEENEAMQYYKTDGFYDINSDLREAGYSEDDRADIIESVIDGTSLSRSVVAYRGADWDVFDEENLTGGKIEDGAFVSTSLVENVAAAHAEGVILEIHVPKGAHAVNMERWQVGGWAEGEAELLLQRDAAFEVISDDFGTDPDTRRMVLELILP